MTSTAVPRSTARLRRIDLRVVIGLALLLAGVLGTVAVVQRAGQRVPVLVVAREVPAGQVVGDQDVRVAELGLAPGVATLESTTVAEWWDRWRACRWPPGRS
jgi:hypothetical protein